MGKLMRLFFGLLLIAVLVVGCSQAAPEAGTTPTEAEPAAPAEAAEPAGEEAAAPAAETSVDVIKVGALYPLTGPDAGWAGDPYVKSHQLAIDKINAAGGIACLGGAKLELVTGDSQGKAEAGNSEMERLITQEEVIAVMGSALSGTTLPASEVAEKFEVPYIVPNALDGVISDRGLKYVFQTVSTLQQWGADNVAWAKENGAKTAVITVPNITFGTEVEDTWLAGIENEGLELLASFTYDANTNDFTDTILRVKQEDPDVWFLLGNAETPQVTKQAREQGYWPKMGIITLGSGFATSFYLNETGADNADGIIVTQDFAPVSALNVSEDFKQEFKEFTGQDLGGTYNTTYASTWLLADALEAACSTDPKVLAETLRTTTFTDGQGKWGFQWPEASFDERGRLEQAATVMAQWQNGQQVAIWPDDLAAAEAVWPVPGWDAREGGLTGEAIEQPAAEETAAMAGASVMDILNSDEVSQAALDSDYSRAILADAETAVDTAAFQKEGPYVIAASQQDASNGWGNTYNITISAYGDQLLAEGILAQPLLNSVTNDANQQISDLENFIEQQPDAIVVEPLGRAASTTVIKRAIAAGIPVILCANGIEGEDFTSRVDVDFWEVAYKSGIGLAELMGGEGKVVVFNGIAGVDSTETWQAAALSALEKYPGIEIVATEYAQWNIATAKQKMEAIMAANPEIDGVWAGGGEMALGAALAFEDAGIEPPKFAMVNVPNGFLRLAEEYGYEFVGSPDPPAMSRYCLQTAVDILQGKEVTKFVPLRDLMDGADPYDHTDFLQWYVPELNDDFIPPATVDVQYYIDGGFARK
jgi:ABC-type sugar transport system substrate-binding protein/ABC-type branched-subunit amino acid transport system substrate-binding protein